jgi:hypothetical protein
MLILLIDVDWCQWIGVARFVRKYEVASFFFFFLHEEEEEE